MDEVFAPENAIDKAALKALSRRSDARGLAQLVGHLAMLGATGAAVAASLGTLWLAPAMLVHGVVLIFLFAPLHECIHRTAFESRALNDGLAWLCGAVMLLPPVYFRTFHFVHHRHTQDPARDPELALLQPDDLGRYLLRVTGLPYWRERGTTLLRHALTGRVAQPFVTARQSPAVVREARLLLLCYAGIAAASVALESWAAVLYWIAPALIGQPALRLYLLAEHTGCPFVPDMLRNSRTTGSNRLVRRLAWNMPYHAEHHAYPALPFHALPAAHTLLAPRIETQAPGYWAAHRDILAYIQNQPR
ncbi:MAG: fatty acid desaturase [Alphaproteobacteria bacterium]